MEPLNQDVLLDYVKVRHSYDPRGWIQDMWHGLLHSYGLMPLLSRQHMSKEKPLHILNQLRLRPPQRLHGEYNDLQTIIKHSKGMLDIKREYSMWMGAYWSVRVKQSAQPRRGIV